MTPQSGSMASTPPAIQGEAASGADLAALASTEPLSVAVSQPAPVNKKPSLPSSFFKFPVRARLKAIQQYISSFEYRQGPRTSFNSHKLRPLARIMDTAKMMIYNPQPIKCVEAVFLALYLTAGIADAERIPLGFKSELHGQVHQHIVLLVRYNSKYGAFGISRQKNLMSKEFEFESLSSIVDDFKKAYETSDHKVVRIRVGLPVEHKVESFNFVCWRYLSLDPSSTPWEQCSEALERHISQAKRLWERWLLDGQRENRRADLFLRKLDKKGTLEMQEKKPRRKDSDCSSIAPTLKAVKRRQEPDKQEPDNKLVKRRQALREIPATGNIPNQSFSCKIATRFSSKLKGLPSLPSKRSPREPLTSSIRCSRCQSSRNEPLSTGGSVSGAYKTNIKKIAVKCYSIELFPSSCSSSRLSLRSNQQASKLYLCQDGKDTRRAKASVRKPE